MDTSPPKVAMVPPTAAEAPTTVAALQAVVREAHATATPLRIVGAGQWLRAGRPVVATQPLSTRALSQVIEYVPDDLVITVGAGMPLHELAAITAEHDQWLALDPWGPTDDPDAGTVGATIATASQGPLALGYGRVRDLVLGLSFITGDGTAVQAGGRVVKNVAGFDLVRMSTGAWGTLGVLTAMSLRLHARPAEDASWVVAIDAADPAARTALVARLNSAPLLPYTSALAACLLLDGVAAQTVCDAVGLPVPSCLVLARGTGNPAAVAAQAAALATLGTVTRVPSTVWRTVRGLGGDPTRALSTFRLTRAPQATAETLTTVQQWCATHGATDAAFVSEPLRGTVRVSATLAAHAPAPLPTGCIADELPAAWWPLVPSAVDDPISARLRARFDPAGVLNPGLLGTSSLSRTSGA